MDGGTDMPSKSGRQHRYFEMIAHDPGAAKREGVPKSVGEEFAKADEGKKFPDKGGRGRYTGKKAVQ